MLYIAHRGLIDGPDTYLENDPRQIERVLAMGFDAEIDLWVKDGEFFLGHNLPVHYIHWNFLDNKHLWVHCKNLEALFAVRKQYHQCQYFWHQEDDFTLTSGGHIWTYPGKPLTSDSICVMPEWQHGSEFGSFILPDCFGICSDYVNLLKSKDIEV